MQLCAASCDIRVLGVWLEQPESQSAGDGVFISGKFRDGGAGRGGGGPNPPS